MSSYARLVRFVPAGADSSQPLIGEPTDPKQDVGLASFASEDIEVEVFSGHSILSPGERTGKKEKVKALLSPLAASEVGTIRCVGLNYVRHAKEVNMAIPDVPTLFMKPSTALADPYPAPIVIPKAFVKDNAADYESEVAIVIGKAAKDVSEDEALEYLLGFTASNDVSSRLAQFAQSQWCFSKSFDGACPIGPAFVPKSQVSNIEDLKIRGSLNGKVVQESGLELVISLFVYIGNTGIYAKTNGTTLLPGTVIITGTPAGVGWSSEPRSVLKDKDEFRVFVSHGVGTLINKIVEQK